MARSALAILIPVLVTLGSPTMAAARFDESAAPIPTSERLLSWLQRDEEAIAAAQQEQLILQAQPPADDFLARLVGNLALENAQFRYREAVRAQQRHLLDVASDPALASQVESQAPPELAPAIHDTVGAWHAIWRLDGIDEFYLVRIHPRPLGKAEAPARLATYYREAAARYQLDWAVLASINFVESDFGRVNGPSSAGAVGPMQFLPSTWEAYGQGDINNAKDAIEAAARYLFLHGGLRDMDRAIYAYNHDSNYVQGVNLYAQRMRQDPTWLDRLYYWNTLG
jgi:soluble lytic murein transglycosylase-like protein